MKIGIIREGKVPQDSRVPLTPLQCKVAIQKGFDIIVQPSDHRCYSDKEYQEAGIPMAEDVTNCEILLGVKEVPIQNLIADKTYFFFSHTIKEQVYNRDLLQATIDKNIRLIDYEVLTNEAGQRVIAFGKFAGMVGAHNALWTYAQRTGKFNIPRMKDIRDYKTAKEIYKAIDFPSMKVLLTGTGRVAGGAAQVLDDMGFNKVSAQDYLVNNHSGPVYAQLNSFHYVKRKDGRVFDSAIDFYKNPKEYESDFEYYLPVTDVMINGIFWNNEAPAFFTKEQMQSSDFKIKVISDVTCDIAPVSSIPSTLKATTIENPVFGYNPFNDKEDEPFQESLIDMMTIDNLPNEMPRDASEAFGSMFMEYILEEFKNPNSSILARGTVARDGELGKHFSYLNNYLHGI